MATGPGGRPRFSLASWSGHDAAGLGCPFAFALVMRPVRLVVGLLMSVFTQANPVASQVRLLLLGKEQLKLQGLRNFFDQASTTLLCHYHVIRSLLNKMDQLKMPASEQERVCRTLRAMLACLHERTYADNLRRLVMGEGRFARHFRRVWHEQRDLWAGFRRSGLVPWCAGVNDRVEALVQFQQAVCSQSRSLCEAVCNLAYGAHGVLAQTTTEAMLDEIREYHVQLLDYEARLIAACCDYAAVHVLVQIRISRSHKFSVLDSGSQLVVNSIAGKGTLPLGGFACDCAFRQTYRLPCTHAFVVAHARNVEIPLDEVHQRWRRCGPFPIDLTAGGGGGGAGEDGESWSSEGQREYQERLSRARDLSEALCSVAAHSAPDGWLHMQTVLAQLYRTWARDPGARVSLALEDGTLLPTNPPTPVVAPAAPQHAGLEDNHHAAMLSDDDADMPRDSVKSNVFAGTQLEKSEPPCSPGGLLGVPGGHHHHHHHQGGGNSGDGVTSSDLGSIKMPDDAVFGFSGGIFKEAAAEAAAGGRGNGGDANHHHQHCVVSTVAGTASTTSAPACEEAKLSAEDDVYRLHSGDLSCFTASISGANEGAQAAGEQLSDLFGYGSDFAKGLQAEGRDSPVLLSIKDDELCDGSKEVARIKWDNEESYKLLDSIMEADASEKLAECVSDDMMATDPTGQQLQASMESAARSLLEDIKASTEAPSQ
uniref:SWIM-type domain-containing protein n=1 Tax=Amblyomma aureolatum TaxID=187763 RepID=A0A1E1X4U8_9ACAR